MAKHYPPAYYRYRETHKTISFVVSEKLKETLDDLRGERSYADFLREAFKPGGLMEQIQKDTEELLRLEARRDAFERNVKALADAQKRLARYRSFPLGTCTCGKSMIWDLEDPKDLKLLEGVIDRSDIIHTGCKPRLRYSQRPPAQ